MKKRYFFLLLALLIMIGLVACGNKSASQETTEMAATGPTFRIYTVPTIQTVPQPTEPPRELTEEEKILAERRDLVEQYMRQSVSVVWRAGDDVHYTCYAKGMDIVAGRLYSGIPYAHSGGTSTSFFDYSQETDEYGYPIVSGLTTEAFEGEDAITNRLGNDCSSAVIFAWSQIGASVEDQVGTGTGIRTYNMIPKYGFIPVGDYVYEGENLFEEDGSRITNTKEVIRINGNEKMYQCYAQLQKGDAVVKRSGSGHVMMVVSVSVIYDANGNIDPAKSTATFLDQRVTYQRGGNTTYVDEVSGEEVCLIGGVDFKSTFSTLLSSGYLPVTCKELIDPSPIEQPVLTDSETELSYDNILTGNISCNWFIDAVTMTITDSNGQQVQKATVSTNRNSYRNFDMQKFVTDIPETVRGSLDLEALEPGDYHCKVVCRLTTEEEIVARDFDFTI